MKKEEGGRDVKKRRQKIKREGETWVVRNIVTMLKRKEHSARNLCAEKRKPRADKGKRARFSRV